MSFNIRCDIPTTLPGEPDYWPDRKPLVSQMIKEARPHIIGLQELMSHQKSTIVHSLPKSYQYVGKPRDKNNWSEQNAIFYDSDYLCLIQGGTFWLSDTPKVKGSVTWNNENPRIVTWAHFYHKSTKRGFTVANTHLDHVSELSRIKSAEMLLNQFGSITETVLLGDFNAPTQTSKAYEILSTAFNDAMQVGKIDGIKYGTFNNYQPPVEDDEHIDWILTSKDLVVEKVKVNTFNIDGKYPSDHLPIEAVLNLN